MHKERLDRSRAVRILARSLYKDMEAQGFDQTQIVALATELLAEVTTRMEKPGHAVAGA